MTATTRLVVLGPPGAQVAVIAGHVAAEFGVPSISILDAAHSAVRHGSELGTELRRYMDVGPPPPDELVAALVARRLGEPDASAGFVFFMEGIPSMPLLVRALEALRVRVVELTLTDAEATRRLTGRRVCRSCAADWHVDSRPTVVAGVCDSCGGEVIQREEDATAAVSRRIARYRVHDREILAALRAGGRLIEVDAEAPEVDVAAEVGRRLRPIGR